MNRFSLRIFCLILAVSFLLLTGCKNSDAVQFAHIVTNPLMQAGSFFWTVWPRDRRWLNLTIHPGKTSIFLMIGASWLKRIQAYTGPFSRKSPGATSTGYAMGGTGWYRKHFTLDGKDQGKTAIISFDGVYMESTVWVNGKKAGNHTYGYTPFWFDITPLLNPAGKENIIAVKVENTGRNSRWYSGSGIYRNVRLILTDPVHIAVWGAQVSSVMVADTLATN